MAEDQLTDRALRVFAVGVGTAIGGFAAGPIGGAAGGTVGAMLTECVVEAVDTVRGHLSGRGRRRIIDALAAAEEEVARRRQAGESLRADEEFVGGDRAKAAEVIEAVLRAAEGSPEEAKAVLLGRMLAAVAFRPDVSARDAHAAIGVTRQATWAQLLLLAKVRPFCFPIAVSERQLAGIQVGEFLGAVGLGLIQASSATTEAWEDWHEARPSLSYADVERGVGPHVDTYELSALGGLVADLMGVEELDPVVVDAAWPGIVPYLEDAGQDETD